MIFAPASIAAFAVCEFIVSMLMRAPLAMNAGSAAIFFISEITRRCSSSIVIRSAPGRVDSPPTSMMFDPAAIKSRA